MKKELNIEIIGHNKSIVISDGSIKMVYIGYSITAAKKRFKAMLKNDKV